MDACLASHHGYLLVEFVGTQAVCFSSSLQPGRRVCEGSFRVGGLGSLIGLPGFVGDRYVRDLHTESPVPASRSTVVFELLAVTVATCIPC